LRFAYPELEFREESKPEIKPAGYWNDINNQRTFFDDLAKSLNIQKPEDWNNVSLRTVLEKGGYFVNSIYKGSLPKGK
jgi:hypothetical protein